MTVAFKTFGCRLNRAEALDQEAAYAAAGHTVIPLTRTTSAVDLIVVRGCSVTARAQLDCEKEIARLRVRFPSAEIKITGCLPNATPRARGTRAPTIDVPRDRVPLSTSRGYLKVQDGCSGRCAFCIVPHFRGSPVSVPFDDVLSRARAFLAAGFRELVVTGCNLALYRAQGHGLPDLLSALADLSPSHRIRLGSLEPGICDEALLDAFAAHTNICRFLHLSLQSASDAVLSRMNRPYRIETVAHLCTTAAERLGPSLSLGADVIAGFPGETEDDHAQTLRFLSNPTPADASLPFTNLHVFPYSERPGTPAATMDGALPHAVRLRRARELERLGITQRTAFARTFVGQTVEVCVERGGNHGWTANYLPCRFTPSAPRRSLVPVRVEGLELSKEHALMSLVGTVVSSASV